MSPTIAIIGSGISGLSCAHRLQRSLKNQVDLQVFESAPQIGGHTATVDVGVDGEQYAIDTGFIVFNNRTYPNFSRLLQELGVQSQASEMSFSVRDLPSGIEYGRADFSGLFAQKLNLLRRSHWQMLRDIVRFNRVASRDLAGKALAPEQTLGDYIRERSFSTAFRDRYLVPMASAIWSASGEAVLEMPLQFFVRFFHNHGLLTVSDQPQWQVLKGGSRSYLEPLIKSFADKIHCNANIVNIVDDGASSTLIFADGQRRRFDHVVFACHSDQALQLLESPSQTETDILSAIPYAENSVILHSDSSVLPRNRAAWSSWNYLIQERELAKPVLTYNMNILQGLEAPVTFCVSVNADDQIDPAKIYRRFNYAHPQFSLGGIAAQQRWTEINGRLNRWFCGAYWANGFHEDGCSSGLRVADAIADRLESPQRTAA